MEITKQQIIHTDVLIIGGGTAGCYAALTIREKSDVKDRYRRESQYQTKWVLSSWS
jgi:FAD binding domain.